MYYLAVGTAEEGYFYGQKQAQLKLATKSYFAQFSKRSSIRDFSSFRPRCEIMCRKSLTFDKNGVQRAGCRPDGRRPTGNQSSKLFYLVDVYRTALDSSWQRKRAATTKEGARKISQPIEIM